MAPRNGTLLTGNIPEETRYRPSSGDMRGGGSAKSPKEPTARNRSAGIAIIRRIRPDDHDDGSGWIRTTEGLAGRFTVCSLCPLGHTP